MDIPTNKRLQCFRNFYGLLKNKGIFVVDVPGDTPAEFKIRSKDIEKYMNDEICASYTFVIPSKEEMLYYKEKAGFSRFSHHDYPVQVEINGEKRASWRRIYLLKK